MPVSARSSCLESSKALRGHPWRADPHRQLDREAASDARLALDAHAALMRLHEGLDDHEPEAGALDSALLHVLGAEERLEHVGALLGAHADPRVPDGDGHAV